MNLIEPTFDKLRDAITEDGASLPEGVTNLDTAARAGVEQQWLRLEELVTQWEAMLALITDWCINGVIPAGDRDLTKYNASMLVFADYDKALKTYGGGILRTVRQVLNCEPALLTFDDVDRLGHLNVEQLTPDEFRGANYQQHKADQEAQKALLENTPRRIY